jgi:hypothetical protein
MAYHYLTRCVEKHFRDTVNIKGQVFQLPHEKVWTTLEDLIKEFRKHDETIPPEIMEDLRAAKSLIQVSRAKPQHIEDSTQIEVYLNNIEFYLIPKAQEKFGQTFADEWMKKLEKARKEAPEEATGSSISKFLPGMPRDTPWVRVKTLEDIKQEVVKALANESGLRTSDKEPGYLLVYGEQEKLKTFMKKMTERFRGARKS